MERQATRCCVQCVVNWSVIEMDGCGVVCGTSSNAVLCTMCCQLVSDRDGWLWSSVWNVKQCGVVYNVLSIGQ